MHNVIRDRTVTGLIRLTCITCKVTLIRQPWMTLIDWMPRLTEFYAQHPEHEKPPTKEEMC